MAIAAGIIAAPCEPRVCDNSAGWAWPASSPSSVRPRPSPQPILNWMGNLPRFCERRARASKRRSPSRRARIPKPPKRQTIPTRPPISGLSRSSCSTGSPSRPLRRTDRSVPVRSPTQSVPACGSTPFLFNVRWRPTASRFWRRPSRRACSIRPTGLPSASDPCSILDEQADLGPNASKPRTGRTYVDFCKAHPGLTCRLTASAARSASGPIRQSTPTMAQRKIRPPRGHGDNSWVKKPDCGNGA